MHCIRDDAQIDNDSYDVGKEYTLKEGITGGYGL